MAEGGDPEWSQSFIDSYSRASGDADETFCDPCKTEDQWKAVVGYCPICEEYLCDNCLGVHRKQKMTRSHVILDTSQMPTRQGSVSQPDLCVEVCQTHHPEIIRYFCTVHNVPGCGDCMTLHHTACKKERVQDISDGYQNTTEFHDIDQQLQQLHQDLENMEGELEDNAETLDSTFTHILHEIRSTRTKMNTYLDQMEKKITDEAAKIKKEDENELKTLQTEHRTMKVEIEALLQTIHDSNINMNSLFIISKQIKHKLSIMEQEINKIKQSQQQQQHEFHISNELEKIISAKTPLGKLSRKCLPQKMKTRKYDERTSPRRTPTVTIDTRATSPRRTPTVTIDTRAIYNRSINVKCKTDQRFCWIRDCALLSPDRLVVIDENNKNMKLIDVSNNTVVSTYSTSSTPYRVTVLSTNMIAVTLYDEGKILVLNVTSTFTLQREINVNKNCWGIAYKDGKFAVSYESPGRVDILDIQGKILHTIQPQQGRNYILRYPYYIIFGRDNDTVIVSDWDTHTVSVVTFSGQVLRTYTHDTLRYPRGIVITADGVLYVCSLNGHCIHAVSPDFKRSTIIINNDKHVTDPTGVTYSDINPTLYICNHKLGGDLNNQIQVYDVNV